MSVFKGVDNWENTYDFQTRDCTFFADCLLMPEEILKNKLYEIIKNGNISWKKIEMIASYFGTPPREVYRRAKFLSLIHH